LSNKLNKLIENVKKAKISAQNKTIYSSEYDFYINTDYATYIENTDATYHSYTFPILRVIESDSLENLVLTLQTDGTYKSILVTYKTTAQEKLNLENGVSFDLTDKISTYDFSDDFLVDNLFTKLYAEGDCVGILTCPFGGDHPATQVCIDEDRGDLFLNTDMCDENGDVVNTTGGGSTGGGSTGGGSTGSSSGGGGQTNNGGSSNFPSNNGATLPTFPCRRDCPQEFDPIHDKNCAELNKISTMQTLQDEFNTLEGSLGLSYEKGFALSSIPQAPNVNPQPKDGESGCKPISMPSGIDVFGFMHTHPNGCGNGTHAMFGHGDIYSLYKYSQSFNPAFPFEWDNSIFTIFMTVDNNHYAIKINDITKLAMINDIFSNKRKLKRFENKLDGAYSNSSNSTTGNQNQLAKAFLQTVTKPPYDLGLSLYKTSHDDINTTDSNWTRLKLDENGLLDDSQDCN
jgi:hypothetical protein